MRDARLAGDLLALGAVGCVVLAVHFAVGDGYGFHRDELQFLDDARHLDWGFVAYPPLTSAAGRAAVAVFGTTPGVLRLPAAVVNALCVALAGLMARALGGGRMAQVVSALAGLPLALVFGSVLQYNTFDLLAWSVTVLGAACVLNCGDGRWWVLAGVGVGVGVESKYSIAFLAVSLLAGVVALPTQRHWLRNRWFWAGIGVAAVVAAPNLMWLARHGFITLRMESYIHARDVRHGRTAGYWTDQLKYTLLMLPLALAGLVRLVRSAQFRLLSFCYVGPLLLLALAKGRGYYLLPGYPVLYAAGAVALEGWVRGRARWVWGAVVVGVVTLVDAGAVSWVYLPVFRVGSAGWKWQMAHNSDMADEVGWPELVAQVAGVRDGLPAADRARLAVLANNYGEAGAVALYGPQYGLPVPISSTNTFHLRGYGPFEPETVIVLGGELEDQRRNFASCEVAARVLIPYGVVNEESRDHPVILVCRHLRGRWPEVWARSQEFG